MNNVDRAKQFLPFDALKGLREELASREEKRLRQERAVLSDSQQAEISDALSRLKKGSAVTLTRYFDGQYVTEKCVIKRIDSLERFILTENAKIYFDDLFSAVSDTQNDN